MLILPLFVKVDVQSLLHATSGHIISLMEFVLQLNLNMKQQTIGNQLQSFAIWLPTILAEYRTINLFSVIFQYMQMKWNAGQNVNKQTIVSIGRILK